MIIGVKMVVIDAASQFIIVARGTILAGIIYGTYNLIGAIVNPNTATNKISSTVTMMPVGLQWSNIRKMARAKLMMVSIRLPFRMSCFLPNLARTGIVNMLQTNCTPVTITPVYMLIEGRTLLMMVLAWVMTPPIPAICIIKGS